MLSAILKLFKVNHYIKNIIVIVPLIFSLNFLKIDLWFDCFIIFLAFCFISSAVYIMNDLIDYKSDCKHPQKCNRPIASGKISKKLALFLFLTLILVSVCLSLYLNITCFACIISYFILNVFYSLYLKHIELIDVACIALGFVLRIISGGFAIEVEPSALVILLTFFTSMFFTFSKRKMELLLLGDNRRKSIKKMSLETINQYIVINAVLSIAFYFTYVMDEATILRADTKYLYITVIPFTLIFFRLLYLNSLQSKVDDPIVYVEKDLTLKALFFVYLGVLLLVLFLAK